MTDEDNAYQGKLLLMWFFTSCSFHSSYGAACSMAVYSKFNFGFDESNLLYTFERGRFKSNAYFELSFSSTEKRGGEVILAYIKEGKTNDEKEHNYWSFFHLSPVNH